MHNDRQLHLKKKKKHKFKVNWQNNFSHHKISWAQKSINLSSHFKINLCLQLLVMQYLLMSLIDVKNIILFNKNNKYLYL